MTTVNLVDLGVLTTVRTSVITPVNPILAKKMKNTSEMFSLYEFWKSFVFSAKLEVILTYQKGLRSKKLFCKMFLPNTSEAKFFNFPRISPCPNMDSSCTSQHIWFVVNRCLKIYISYFTVHPELIYISAKYLRCRDGGWWFLWNLLFPY